MLEKKRQVAQTTFNVAAESRTLPDLFLNRVRASGQRTAMLRKVDGRWLPTTWRQFYEQSAAIASYLLAHDIGRGDKICMLGSTRAEWCLCDMGGQLAGAVTVGAYPTLAPNQIAYIVDHSDSRMLFVEGRADLEKVLSVRRQLPKVARVAVWNVTDLDPQWLREDWIISFETVLATRIDEQAIEARVTEIQADDTAIIVYTSGTTGPPKGAMITHGNIISLLRATRQALPFDADDLSFSFLPMAHVGERIAGFYGRIAVGTAGAFATSIPAVLDEVKEVRPTIFGSVPRIFEKAYARIKGEVEKLSPIRRKIFQWADKTGRAMVRRRQGGESIPFGLRLKYKVADALVFAKIRAVFGGRVQHFVTGAAPIAYEILEFFWAAGFPIYEIYGMTEATIMTHGNLPDKTRLGSVGLPIECVTDRLAQDGEILIHGPTVFKGYYKEPEATAEAIDADGWLHTGDIGRHDSDRFLWIVDRKKHIVITSGGKNITPANIEQEIKSQDPLISQVHVHGDRRPYLTGLITIHPMEAIAWAVYRGLVEDRPRAEAIVRALMENPLVQPSGLADLMKSVTARPEIQRRMVMAVHKANANMARVETVKKIYLLERDFSLEMDEVTPTLKVKRREVEKKFAAVFDRLYTDTSFGLSISDSELV
ncbi:MAG: long-chain fatty acid--CoA ligase [Acidobacteria bacterium]|nr:long-chain fatty acid--CoA ligase [Acidobacteriota bacterium]MBI3658813.1 long-chain fatty acid--CoA ligase [Acidobacteriota bacterium]